MQFTAIVYVTYTQLAMHCIYHQVLYAWCITQTHVIALNTSPSVGCQTNDHFQRGAGQKPNSNSCNERNCNTQEQDEEATHLCSSFEHELRIRLCLLSHNNTTRVLVAVKVK